MKNDRFTFPLSAVGVILAIAAAICLPVQKTSAEQSGTFTGNWTASGQWQSLAFLEGREVATFRLAGHVNLKNQLGGTADFWSECIGLWDAETGSATRCVWRDLAGKEAAYLVLRGQLIKENVEVTGEFVGGAGTLAGLSGTVSFTWSSLFRDETERTLTGHAKELSGSYRYPGGGN